MKNIKQSSLVVLIIVAIPIIMWLVRTPLSLRFSSASEVFRSLGQLTALAGISLFAVNLLIASRIKFVDKLFNGINRAYSQHHEYGEIAFILLIWHPIFLLIYNLLFSSRLATDFMFGFFGRFDLMTGKTALFGMILLLILTIYIKLKYHVWKFSHKFLGIVYFVAVAHILFVSSDVSQFLPLKFYLISLSLLAIAAVIYRVIFPKALVKKYEYSLLSSTVTNGNVNCSFVQGKEN
jgi:predicted ferric reductase